MRVLGIETSSRRGSVALLDGSTPVAILSHEEPNAHAERLMAMIAEILATAGWPRSSLDRLGVGRGPGSFVGLRVGIALAEGLSLGLGRPVVGVPSLAAMAAAVPADLPGIRVAITDARRAELFVHAVSAAGVTLLDAEAIARADARARIAALGSELVLVGEAALELDRGLPVLRGPELDLPHALAVARLAAEAAVPSGPVVPLYVRGPGATTPKLPPSPFGAG